MSLGRVKGSSFWHFRFKFRGIEFRASTRTTDRQVAEAIERVEREKVERKLGCPSKDREGAVIINAFGSP